MGKIITLREKKVFDFLIPRNVLLSKENLGCT